MLGSFGMYSGVQNNIDVGSASRYWEYIKVMISDLPQCTDCSST